MVSLNIKNSLILNEKERKFCNAYFIFLKKSQNTKLEIKR